MKEPSNRLRPEPAESSLDRIDFEILEALQNDARLSNKALAAQVGLAPSSCLLRVRALVERGVVAGVHAEVAPEALGIGVQALIAVRLVQTSRDAFRALRAYVSTLPEVLAVFHVSGAADLQLHVAVRDVGHLRDLICDRIATCKEIDRCESSIIYSYARNPRLPRYVEAPARRRPARRPRRRARGRGARAA
ncbi:MAG TPA: Lrp/AsnC family transcriptional regulator [Kofleriaceae bacterium]|jgi:DNA-binding Lrp family transcriptional regulator|nr:Lrp/AsnC family transcriptional regulator [Kofleriaceae bacterium]